MATLFSYVVDHDLGFAPNPASGYCTLVHCKFQRRGSNRRNIVELAEVGDWILGTGGCSKDSAGPGTVVYLMHVDENPPFQKFLSDRRFRGRSDCRDLGEGNAFALVSRRYFYFGRNALPIPDMPTALATNLVKNGPGFRCDYPAAKLRRLVGWFERYYEIGIHGDPCAGVDCEFRNGLFTAPAYFRSSQTCFSSRPKPSRSGKITDSVTPLSRSSHLSS